MSFDLAQIKMRNINFVTGDNLGGLSLFYYADADDIAYIPAAINGIISDDILMKEGKVFYAFRATQGTLGFSEPMKENRIGSLYSPEFKGFVPKDTPQLQQAFAEITGRRLVILYRDNNGQWKLVSSKAYWLTFERSLDTGTAASSRNGLGFSFKGDTPEAAPFYTGAFTVSETGIISPPVVPVNGGVCRIIRGDGLLLATLTPGQDLIIESGFSFGFRII